MIAKLKGIGWHFWTLLILIITIGIFLRTYNFHEWLRFNIDQARDAEIIHNIILKNHSFPLLGPNAGGTKFDLGPMFYYFQYASSRIFGVSPDKMAYPDLFFSILTIPLLFFFLKKYFSDSISITLTFLYSVSSFAVKYSRFAWNPNSLPFFSILFLYSLLELVRSGQKRKLFWTVIAGITLGVGVQLHTMFLLIVPIVFFVFAGYFLKKRVLAFKFVLTILAMAFVLNTPQLISEIHSHGSNSKAFINGITAKLKENISIPESILVSSEWQFQANTLIISSYGDDYKDDFLNIFNPFPNNKAENPNDLIEPLSPALESILIAGVIFSLFGYGLLFYFLKKETDDQKKIFLKLIILYLGITFLVFIPLADSIFMRYFLIVAFVPFLLLGLILKFLGQKFGRIAFYSCFSFAIILLGSLNLHAVKADFDSFVGNYSDRSVSLLGEEEFIGNYINSHTSPSQAVYVCGGGQFAEKIVKPLFYFTQDRNIEPKLCTEKNLNDEDSAYFSLIYVKDAILPKEPDNYNLEDSASYGRFTIFELEPKI